MTKKKRVVKFKLEKLEKVCVLKMTDNQKRAYNKFIRMVNAWTKPWNVYSLTPKRKKG